MGVGLGVQVGVGVAPQTVKAATAAVTLLPRLVCSAPTGIVLTKLPPFAAVTYTVTVHESLAGIVPPVKVAVVAPGLPEYIPPQVVLPPWLAITRPLGRLSTSGAVRSASVLLELVRVIVRIETSPALMWVGLKALVSEILAMALTVKVATETPALMPLLVTRAPAARELK